MMRFSFGRSRLRDGLPPRPITLFHIDLSRKSGIKETSPRWLFGVDFLLSNRAMNAPPPKATRDAKSAVFAKEGVYSVMPAKGFERIRHRWTIMPGEG